MKTQKPGFFTFVLLIVNFFFLGDAFAQNTKISTESEIKEQIQLAPCNSEKRFEEVKKLFQKAGAKESDISVEKFKEGENFVVKLKGNTDETIVVGAHYDKLGKGCGAIDNWTGIVIIANLYKTLSQFQTNKSFVFVAFDKEEIGLLGSKAMVKSIPKENFAQYCSMVNVDSFGFAPPQAPANMSNPKMIKMAKNLAKEMQVNFADASINNADADSSSFLSKKIPAITFHGLSGEWQKYLHGENDKTENVNASSVYLGYRFILSYLAKIDATNCAEFK